MLQMEEERASNVQANISIRRVAETVNKPRSTIQNIIRNILRYYPYKLQIEQKLFPNSFETRHYFSLQFFALIKVFTEWP